MRNSFVLASLVSLLVSVVGCGDDDTGAAPDAAVDASDDATADTGVDGSTDAAADAVVDAASDAASESDGGNDDAGPMISRVPGLTARPANPTCVAWAMDSAPPTVLSETGCFGAEQPGEPLPAMVPFEPIAKLWSDNAQKHRWFAIPDGSHITVREDGDFEFPNGTVLAKTFELFGKKIETRLFVRHPEGEWRGYAYEWNTAETEATLLSDEDYLANGKQLTGIGDTQQSWLIPSRNQCVRCHTPIAGDSLGLEVAQLNSDLTYPSSGVTANQLVTLDAIGMFESGAGIDEPFESLPRLSAFTSGDSLARRARSYLHINCSMCHRSGGQCTGDFRFQTAERDMGVCNVPAISSPAWTDAARLIKPGDPEHSVVALRMRAPSANDAIRMPPLASDIIDNQGVNIIEAWIRSMQSCPQ